MKRLGGLLVLLLLFFSCAREGLEVEGAHPLPRGWVQLDVSLDHEGRELRNPYSLMLFEEPTLEGQHLGHMGIVLVHEAGGKYCVFDLACPYCWPEAVAVEERGDSNDLLAMECPQCHTVYDLSMGLAHPISGKGKYPLLGYRVTQVGERLLVR